MGADPSGVGSAPPLVDTDAAAIVPAELLQRFAESPEIGLLLNIFGERVEHADAPHPTLLRTCRNRPRSRAAEQRDELAPPDHSITSSAMASSDGGTVTPSIRAVSALMTSSNFDACTTGRSAGLAPFRMRPV